MVDTLIRDTDQDTKVETEASSDEDKVRLTTAGTERMIIDNNGKVGIGTASPTKRLDVAGVDGDDYCAVIEKRLSVRHIDGKSWNDGSVANSDLYLNHGVDYNVYLVSGTSTGKVGIVSVVI